MVSDIIVFGGDKRLVYTAEILAEKYGHTVHQYVETPIENLSDLVTYSTIIIPIPFSTDGESVFTPFYDKAVSIGSFFGNLSPSIRIIGGTIPETFEKQLSFYYDITKDERFVQSNLQPTVEGIIQFLLNTIDYSLAKSRICIIGYGRLGKLLAQYLMVFNADVTVCCSNSEEINTTKAANLRPCKMENKSDFFDADIIVNTVPAYVTTESELKLIPLKTLLLDVASVPGGFDPAFAEKLGLNFTILRGIPGKKAPKTAAGFISKLIDSRLKEWG